MGEPGRRSRAIRTLVAILLVVAGGSAVLPGTASAQSAPPLATEFLLSEALGFPEQPGHEFDAAGTCDFPDASTFSFEAAGLAGGVYAGTFTEEGTVTLAAPPAAPNGAVTAFESAFTIDSGAYTITGTKRFTAASAPTGSNEAVCVGDELVFFTARVEYEATIQGPGGTDHQEGIAIVNATDAEVGSQAFPEGRGQFLEVFVTSSPAEEEPGPPAALTLEPGTATNVVGEEHCVTATVTDAEGRPVPGVEVVFTVEGSNPRGPTAVTTDQGGRATFCYTGSLPGADTIRAFADTDEDGEQDAGEPAGVATKVYVPPASMTGCRVTGGGRLLAANGDRATFGVTARAVAPSVARGEQVYQDHGPATRLTFKSTATLSVVCSANRVTIFGEGEVDQSAQVLYRIDLTDAGEPGFADTYRIQLVGGAVYDSGEQPLTGGNIQVRPAP